MDPYDFEKHVMSFFEQWGHPVYVTPKSNDYGVDGTILHPKGLIVVQCKRYDIDISIGSPEAMKFLGAITHHKAMHGYYVTTSGFTHNAIKVAAENPQIMLINGTELLSWHKGVAIRLPEVAMN